MVYFNYFIKCIIRKFVNIIFKPKFLLPLFIIIFILHLFCGIARAEWSDDSITRVIQDLESIAGSNIKIYQQLEQINTTNTSISEDVIVLRRTLTSIDTAIYDVIGRLNSTNQSLDEVKSQLNSLLTDISTLNQSITDIYNKLDENQKELLLEMEKDNQAVLEELNMIRDSINGSEEELTTYNDLGITISSNAADSYYRLKCISINYEPRYSYRIKVYFNNTETSQKTIRTISTNNKIPNNYNIGDFYEQFVLVGVVPGSSSDYSLIFEVPANNPNYIYFSWGDFISKIEVYRSIKGITESLNQSNNLQQQQNQLQQEQNNFMQQETQDSSVDINGFNNVDSNDITSSGLTGVFNNIYNSISSWSSKDINLPIPYTNKSINIPANYTYNMLSSVGGGWLITFISVIYYFVVGRFIIYSITGIINSIKSGSILETDSKDNITTDML